MKSTRTACSLLFFAATATAVATVACAGGPDCSLTSGASELEKVIGVLGSGQEVVFTLCPKELRRRGLDAQQVAAKLGGRFWEQSYEIEVEGRTLDAADLALIEVRDLVAEPFIVELADGRRLRVTPDPKRIADYLVTGGYFEAEARGRLMYSPAPDPAKTVVLAHIPVPGGHIPNYWDENHVHYSLGEPLDAFATVEVLSPAKKEPE